VNSNTAKSVVADVVSDHVDLVKVTFVDQQADPAIVKQVAIRDEDVSIVVMNSNSVSAFPNMNASKRSNP